MGGHYCLVECLEGTRSTVTSTRRGGTTEEDKNEKSIQAKTLAALPPPNPNAKCSDNFLDCGEIQAIPLRVYMHRHRPRDLRTGYDIHKMSACPFSPSFSRNAFPPRKIPSRRQIHVPAGPVHTIWRSPLHHPRVVFVSVLLLQTMLIFVAGSALNKQVHET